MIGLTRLYCYKGKLFRLVDVRSQDSPEVSEQLAKDGWIIEAKIPVCSRLNSASQRVLSQ